MWKLYLAAVMTVLALIMTFAIEANAGTCTQTREQFNDWSSAQEKAHGIVVKVIEMPAEIAVPYWRQIEMIPPRTIPQPVDHVLIVTVDRFPMSLWVVRMHENHVCTPRWRISIRQHLLALKKAMGNGNPKPMGHRI